MTHPRAATDRDAPAGPIGSRPAERGLRWVVPVAYLLVLAIVAVDWLTPAGVVVGIFLTVPIVLASITSRRTHVVGVWVTALVGFTVAAVFGRGPLAPELVWIPNRLFTTLTLLASGVLALSLQRRRLDAEAARAAAESALDLGRVMHSLMAHDLRSPLVLAHQGFTALQGALDGGAAVDPDLVAELQARMDRSLRTVETVLRATRVEIESGERSAAGSPLQPLDAAREVGGELETFRAEAERRGMRLEIDSPAQLRVRANGGVLRQGLSILLDNAIRHADPGPVRVSAQVEGGELQVRVADSGPGFSARRKASARSPEGSGIGLRLCQLLAHRAGGGLDLARDGPDGTEFVLRLPAQRG